MNRKNSDDDYTDADEPCALAYSDLNDPDPIGHFGHFTVRDQIIQEQAAEIDRLTELLGIYYLRCQAAEQEVERLRAAEHGRIKPLSC